jgi:hypothetical protein
VVKIALYGIVDPVIILGKVAKEKPFTFLPQEGHPIGGKNQSLARYKLWITEGGQIKFDTHKRRINIGSRM